MTSHPNILLITTDEQRYDAAGFDNPVVQTPNLDALAERGVVFDRAYTCCPVCTPARVSMLTGCYPSRHGCYNIGVTLVGMKKPAEAVPHFQKAVELMPDFGKAHFNLSMLLVQEGKNSEAMDHLREAAALMPDSPEVRFSFGRMLAQRGDREAAAEEFRQALAIARDAGRTRLARQIEASLFALQKESPGPD